MTTTQTTTEIALLPLDLIDAGDNDRKTFDATEIDSLARSIETIGQLSPIIVRPVGGRYEIVAGERRFRATQQLGLPAIKAIVEHLTDAAASWVMLAENTGRVDLNPIEESDAFQSQIDAGATVDQIVEAAGVTKALVTKRLALQALCPQARFLVATGQLTAMWADLLVKLDSDRQVVSIRAWNKYSLGWMEAESLTSKLLDEQNQQQLMDLDDFLVVEQYVKEVKREDNALNPVAMAKLLDKLLAAYNEVVADEELSAEAQQMLKQVKANVDYRLKR